jgi:hypothetical protein
MIGAIFNAKDYCLKPKATIQQSGKLGFNGDAIEQLQINATKSIVLAPESSSKDVYYMALVDGAPEFAFPIRVSGKYFYANTKQLFDKLEIPYVETSYIFDLVRCERYDGDLGGECYKMTARKKPRTQEDSENEE